MYNQKQVKDIYEWMTWFMNEWLNLKLMNHNLSNLR